MIVRYSILFRVKTHHAAVAASNLGEKIEREAGESEGERSDVVDIHRRRRKVSESEWPAPSLDMVSGIVMATA